MISEEEFVLKARQEWRHLQDFASQSEDFYTFEKEFEHHRQYEMHPWIFRKSVYQ